MPLVDETLYEMRRRFLAPLPSVRVANWSSVTPAFLARKRREIAAKSFDIKELFMPHWYHALLTATDHAAKAAKPVKPCGFGPHPDCDFEHGTPATRRTRR